MCRLTRSAFQMLFEQGMNYDGWEFEVSEGRILTPYTFAELAAARRVLTETKKEYSDESDEGVKVFTNASFDEDVYSKGHIKVHAKKTMPLFIRHYAYSIITYQNAIDLGTVTNGNLGQDAELIRNTSLCVPASLGVLDATQEDNIFGGAAKATAKEVLQHAMVLRMDSGLRVKYAGTIAELLKHFIHGV